MKIVLDTNCLLQIIPRKAKHRWFFDMIKSGDVHLSMTSEILSEYEEQLAMFYSPVVADGVLQIFHTLQNVAYIQVYYKWNLITADPDDNKFSDCAIAAGADYLVTYDKHFNALAETEFPKVSCISLEALKEILSPDGVV
jgi:putative PIN family toxin of toxin-antitoxin system